MTVFAAARCWLLESNPYRLSDLIAAARAGGADPPEWQFSATPSMYLPSGLLIFSPFALLAWPAAKVVMDIVCLGAFLWMMKVVGRLSGGMSLLLAAFLFSFAPVHSGFGQLQPGIIACSLIAAGVASANPLAGGILLGIAACIKPQLAIGFLGLAVMLGRYRKLAWALGTTSIVGAVSVARMSGDVLAYLSSTLTALNTESGIITGLGSEDLSFQLLNVDILLPHSVVVLAYAAILLVTLYAIWQAAGNFNLSVALTASATLLVGYHRFYDAQILLLGIPLLMTITGRRAALLTGCYALFLIPGQTMAAQWVPLELQNTSWYFALSRHQSMACLVIWLTMVTLSVSARTKAV